MANRWLTKDGYRYYWTEEDAALTIPNDACRRLNIFRRKLTLSSVRLSEIDRAPQLKLDANLLSVTGDKGYSMVRATHGINRGRFYYEITIDKMPGDSAARVGWGQKYCNLQAPLGYDEYGYSYRSRFGTKFHKARGLTYDRGGGYGEGDTIGCLIELPYGNKKNITLARHLPPSVKDTAHFLLVSNKKKDISDKPMVLEEKDDLSNTLNPLPGSRLAFYKNGQYLGVAFQDIPEGSYYPSISLYKNCKVTVNFGPKFLYPPPQESHKLGMWQPASQMADIELIDNLLSDLSFLVHLKHHPEGDKIEQAIQNTTSN